MTDDRPDAQQSVTADAPTEPAIDTDALSSAMQSTVRADHVEIRQGGANNVEGREVSIVQGGASRVRAGSLSIEQGGVAVARTRMLTLGPQSGAFAVVTDRADVRSSGVFLLAAREVTGDVRPILDLRAAAVLGAILVIVPRLLRRSRGR